MVVQDQYRALFAYHWKVTQRLLECAAKLSDAEYTANPGYGHGSIHALLLHTLITDNAWRRGLIAGAQQPPLAASDYPDLAAIRQGFADEQAAWEALLADYDDATIINPIALSSARGTLERPLWKLLQQVLFHGMQHHTEIAQLLTSYGQSPGDFDFLYLG